MTMRKRRRRQQQIGKAVRMIEKNLCLLLPETAKDILMSYFLGKKKERDEKSTHPNLSSPCFSELFLFKEFITLESPPSPQRALTTVAAHGSQACP